MRRGVLLTVESLRLGLTSEPETFARLLRTTGAPACFDVGHAHGSDWVQRGRGSVVEVLRAVPTRVAATQVSTRRSRIFTTRRPTAPSWRRPSMR
jgi:hypothetical protein